MIPNPGTTTTRDGQGPARPPQLPQEQRGPAGGAQDLHEGVAGNGATREQTMAALEISTRHPDQIGVEALSEIFYQQHRPRIVGLARRWVSAADAEDVAQEVLCHIHEHGQRASLFLLVRNYCIDIHRRNEIRRKAESAYLDAEAGMLQLQAHHQVNLADTVARLAQSAADPVERAVIGGLMDGKSGRKMALEMGVGVKQINRKKKNIRAKLAKESHGTN